MSSVDPSWPPPNPHPPDPQPGVPGSGPAIRYPRPSTVTTVFAVVLPIVLLLALAAPLGIAFGIARLRSPAADDPTSARGPVAPDEGRPGVGDPYFPDYGSSGYDALRYTVNVSWDPSKKSMTAATTIEARSTQALRSFYVDLALTTDRVTVDGRPARFAKSGFQDVEITPAEPIPAGTDFRVVVDYSGDPAKVSRGGTTAWYVTGDEWTVAGEPESSAWWFPANDHPSDPALMDVSVRVPAGMEAVSVGRLVSRDSATEADFDTWHWLAEQPMATYLSFVSIGQYALQEGVVDGRPYVYAVSEQLSASDRDKAFTALNRSGAIVRTLESVFGPYPFAELGGIVPAHRLAFDGLETQTRPVYARGAVVGDGATDVVVHELAHMWFGDHVTVRNWDDIFMNEAFASFAQWAYTERTGGRSADAAMNALFDRARDRPRFWQVTMIDPGPEHLFDAVYSRGPMTLQALRNRIGDAAFFALVRDWGQEPGSRGLEEWMVEAQSRTRVDLVPFFQAWIYAPRAPARTAANGFAS